MGKNSVSADEFILSAQVAISNALEDEEIKNILAGYGYTETKLTVGKNLLDETKGLLNTQKKEYGEKFGATSELNKTWEKVNQAYGRALKVARVAFQDDIKAQAGLMLHGERKKSLPGWLVQAEAFYANMLKDSALVGKMGEFGYSAAKLQGEFAGLKVILDKNQQQKKGKGQAQEATEAKDKKLDALGKWYSDFRAICKVALDDTPQKLEKLGILARSSPKDKKPKETAALPSTAQD